MHHFEYIKDEFYCENVPVARIAEKVGTPFYLYSHATLKRHFEVFKDAFQAVDSLVCYSAKANTIPFHDQLIQVRVRVHRVSI